MAKKVAIKEKFDPRAIKSPRVRVVSRALAHAYHTINIAEQEGELSYVDVFVSGTIQKKDDEIPFARNFQIQRGMDVINVPAMVVHALVDTGVETRYRQEKRESKDGTKRNAFIPFKRHSYPCTIIESYDEKKELSDEEEGFREGDEETIFEE